MTLFKKPKTQKSQAHQKSQFHKKSKDSPYNIPLISGVGQWAFVIAVLALIFAGRVGWEYHKYANLPFENPAEITAQVLLQYQKTKPEKPDKPYFVLKLDSQGHIFYATSHDDLRDLQGRFVRVWGKVDKKCDFVDYFKSCFFIAFSISLMPQREFSAPLKAYFSAQHENEIQASLFGALFFADSLDKKWRDMANRLGLAHIIAISGYHLGVLSAFLFAIFAPMYRFFQSRFFSYRNEFYDLGAIILLCMCGYLVLLDFTPSFLRALVAGIAGFLLLFWGLELISFKMLGLVGLICIAIFPNALFSVGFALSMAGVFYIFLFVRHCPKMPILPYFALFNVAIFFSITPIVHYFFPYFSPYQLVSIPVSVAFVAFFPLVIVLHIFGFGGIFDRWLNMVVNAQISSIDYYLPLSFALIYVALSFGAIASKKIYVVMLLCAVGFWGYMLLRFVNV